MPPMNTKGERFDEERLKRLSKALVGLVRVARNGLACEHGADDCEECAIREAELLAAPLPESDEDLPSINKSQACEYMQGFYAGAGVKMITNREAADPHFRKGYARGHFVRRAETRTCEDIYRIKFSVLRITP